MYCAPDDLRCEGVSTEQASDERLIELCELAGRYIEVMTGQWFEPREKTLRIDGSGGEILPLPLFLIRADFVRCHGQSVEDYTLYNRIAPEDDRDYPRLKRRSRWSKGDLNIEIKGLWGYVDEGADGSFVTPVLVRQAAKKLVIMQLPLLGDVAAQEEKLVRGMLTSETTDGHSYTLDRSLANLISEVKFTGDMEIDQILSRYSVQRIGMGVA